MSGKIMEHGTKIHEKHGKTMEKTWKKMEKTGTHGPWPTNHKINLDIRKDITNLKSWKYKHTHVGWMGGWIFIYIYIYTIYKRYTKINM
jgi:hypothetical protein